MNDRQHSEKTFAFSVNPKKHYTYISTTPDEILPALPKYQRVSMPFAIICIEEKEDHYLLEGV